MVFVRIVLLVPWCKIGSYVNFWIHKYLKLSFGAVEGTGRYAFLYSFFFLKSHFMYMCICAIWIKSELKREDLKRFISKKSKKAFRTMK